MQNLVKIKLFINNQNKRFLVDNCRQNTASLISNFAVLNIEVIRFKSEKIVLNGIEPSINPTSDEMANVVLSRIGLLPRKKGATDKMHRALLEMYERAKKSYRTKKPELAVMTVEEMGMHAGITRQTMYDYLRRWTEINLIVKTSYIYDGKVVVGYKLNGNTIEQAFEKAMGTIKSNMDATQRYIRELQRLVKNEKIAETQATNQKLESENSIEA